MNTRSRIYVPWYQWFNKAFPIHFLPALLASTFRFLLFYDFLFSRLIEFLCNVLDYLAKIFIASRLLAAFNTQSIKKGTKQRTFASCVLFATGVDICCLGETNTEEDIDADVGNTFAGDSQHRLTFFFSIYLFILDISRLTFFFYCMCLS